MKKLFLLLFISIVTFLQPSLIHAEAVPVEKTIVVKETPRTRITKKQKQQLRKKKFKAHQKLKKQQKEGLSWIWWVLIIWYIVSIALLIIGLVFAIPPLWITAVVLLCIPVAAVIIFGIVFLIMLATSSGSWE